MDEEIWDIAFTQKIFLLMHQIELGGRGNGILSLVNYYKFNQELSIDWNIDLCFSCDASLMGGCRDNGI